MMHDVPVMNSRIQVHNNKYQKNHIVVSDDSLYNAAVMDDMDLS